MGEHLKGSVITTLGVLLVVPDSLFVRLIEVDSMITAFWRSLTAAIFALLLLLLMRELIAGYLVEGKLLLSSNASPR